MFVGQIVAQTRDIFAIWKIVTISDINDYHKTFRVFHILFSFRTFVIIWVNLFGKKMKKCLKSDMDLNH